MHAIQFALAFNVFLLSLQAVTAADPRSIDLSQASPAAPHAPRTMGSARNPAGHTVSLDSTSLLLDDKPWLPVLAEFHDALSPAGMAR